MRSLFVSCSCLPRRFSLFGCFLPSFRMYVCVVTRVCPFLSLAASTQVYVFPLLEQVVFSDTWCPVESMQPCFLCSSCFLPGERGLSSILLLFSMPSCLTLLVLFFRRSSCILPGERGLPSIVLLFFHAFLYDAPCVVLRQL